MPMPIRNSLALAALATSLFAMPALGQPAHLSSTPASSRAAPSLAQQAAFLNGFVASRLLVQQRLALPSQESTTSETPEPAVEPVESLAVAASAAPVRVLTSTPPSALDARGADGAAQLSWRLPDGGRAARYRVYYDDGALAAARVQRTVLASDECPSQVVFVAGARPESGWASFAELDGAATGVDLTGLDNGQPYAFAVAAVDDAGVVGPLSDVSCAIPSAHGEYELDDPTPATAASLTGAEGGCSFAPPTRDGSLAPALVLAGAAALGMVLRRRSSARVLEG